MNYLSNSTEVNFAFVTQERYIWNIDMYGAAACTRRKVDQKYLGSFEMGCWKRMENIN
jgi:hypothetical protein